MILNIRIAGQPVAKGRPKFSTVNGFPMSYTPAKTRNSEASIRMQTISQLPKGFTPLSGPLSIHLVFSMQRPKSLKKSIQFNTKRPDADNLGKQVIDALNTVAFVDDSQIVSLSIIKKYGTPETTIVITELDDIMGLH